MRVILTLLLCLAVTNIYAQNTITGTIKNGTTNENLEFVTVYLPQLEKGTTTNKNGSFTINNIPSGNHKIIFSIIGFETFSETVSLPTSTPLSISLTPSAIEMEEIIISTPFHKLQSENVMKVERESISELKQNGAINLADGITNIAGVESITTGISIGKPTIRGLSSNRVLVYAQGIRLENQQFGSEHGLGLSDSGIESVEVIKGPASLLYGSDALGGVLYINPEKFATSNESKANIETNYFSNTLGYNTNAGYKVSGDKFKFLFRGSLAEHSDYNTESYRVTNTRFREQDFKAGFGYQVSKFKTEFRYNVNHSKLGIPEELGESSKLKTPLLPYQDITNHIFSTRSTLFFENSRLDFNLGYTYNDRKEFEEEHEHGEEEDHDEEGETEEEHDEHDDDEHDEDEILAAALHMKLKTANYDVKYNLPKMGKLETILGLQGLYQENKNYGEEQLIPNATTNDIGIFATSHIHFNNADVQLGARFDNRRIDVQSGISRNFNSFNGAIGVKTDVTNSISVRLNLATGFRAPNLAELTSFGTHEGTNRFEIGHDNLKNEQNAQVDLALEYKSEHFEIFTNGFYNAISDYIYIAPNGELVENTPAFEYLQNNANLYGGEIGFHLHPHPIDWLHLESTFETVTGKQDNNEFLPLIPANSLTNKIRIEFSKNWLNTGYAFIKLRTTFKKTDVSSFETSSEGYNLLSAGLGGTVKVFNRNLNISLSGNNLTDKTYINHLSRLKSDGIYDIGRSFNIGLNYSL